MERLTITVFGMLLIWVLLIVWANWEWGDRKKLIYLSTLLFLIWSTDQVIREVRRPAAEILIFSGEKGILMDFKVGESIYSWNEDFPPEQISFSIEPNRIAQHRPQTPQSVFALEEGADQWFPLGDFQFDKDSRRFRWEKDKPIRIERFSFPNSWESLASDSLIANNGAFRIVF